MWGNKQNSTIRIMPMEDAEKRIKENTLFDKGFYSALLEVERLVSTQKGKEQDKNLKEILKIINEKEKVITKLTNRLDNLLLKAKRV